MASKTVEAAKVKEAILLDLEARDQARILKAIKATEKEVISLVGEFKVIDGKIVTDASNIARAEAMRADLVQVFDDNYGKASRTVVKGYDEAAKATGSYLSAVDIPTTFAVETDGAIIGQLKKSSLGQYQIISRDFQTAIADGVYSSVLTGAKFSEVVDGVTNSLTGLTDKAGRPMTAHAQTLVNDALFAFDADYNSFKAEEAGVVNFLYQGSIIKDSREFCRRHVGEIRTRDDWNAISEAETQWQGQKAGPFFTNRGGWQCQHQLLATGEEVNV